MSAHTKEPWRYTPAETEEEGGAIYAVTGAQITGADSESIFRIDLGEVAGLDDANARRIVTCVNACLGVTPEMLDGGWTAAGLSNYAKDLERQRDELLAALNLIEVDRDGDGVICREAMLQVRAAIAGVDTLVVAATESEGGEV